MGIFSPTPRSVDGGDKVDDTDTVNVEVADSEEDIDGDTDGISDDVTEGVSDGVTDGVSDGVADGVSDTVTAAVFVDESDDAVSKDLL